MADNLKALIAEKDAVFPINGGVDSIKVANQNPFEEKLITQLGRYTGFPFTGQRSIVGGIVGYGKLFWNANAMNKSVPFTITLSKLTADGNNIFRVLDKLSTGDFIKIKDFAGNATTLQFNSVSAELTDGNGNKYFELNVTGFAENTNYAYQPADVLPCMLEFLKFTSETSESPIKYLELRLYAKGKQDGVPNVADTLEPGDFVKGCPDANTIWESAMFMGGAIDNLANYKPIVFVDISDIIF